MKQFESYYLSEHKQLDPVYLVALEFAYETEKFDRSLEHRLDREGVAIPAYWNISKSNNNARDTRRRIISKYSLDREEIKRFRQYDREYFCKRLEVLENLMKLHKEDIEKIQPKPRQIKGDTL